MSESTSSSTFSSVKLPASMAGRTWLFTLYGVIPLKNLFQ